MELLDEERKLLEYVNDVDHDIEGINLSLSLSLSLEGLQIVHITSLFLSTEYVKSLEAIVSQKVERLSNFKG